jgi:excinuclease ABC subunit A
LSRDRDFYCFDMSAHTPASDSNSIQIRGARTHNLKNIDLDIPRDKLVVITGPSGSGKSSLAFDTLFAEGQRQYIESLSAYSRQFLEQLERPDVDAIDGLAPVICIDQRPGAANPRSTVGTSTEIYDYLRLLFARVGEVFCPACGHPVSQQTIEQIQDALMGLPEGTKLMLLAPLVRGRKGQHAEVLDQIRKAGQVRVRIDGVLLDLDAVPPLDGRKSHTVESVVDRIVIRPGSKSRLAESLQLAVKQGDGVVIASYQDGGEWTDRLFNTLYACPSCHTSLAEIEPRTFSFSSPYGACPQCDGLGYRVEFDPELIAPDASRSLRTGAIAPWSPMPAGAAEEKPRRAAKQQPTAVAEQRAAAEQFLNANNTPLDTPLAKMRPAVREQLFRGDGAEFPGLATLLEQEFATALDRPRQQALEMFRGRVACAACGGTRLRPEALAVRLGGKTIAEVCSLSISDALTFFGHLGASRKTLSTQYSILSTQSEKTTETSRSDSASQPSASSNRMADQNALASSPIAAPILNEITPRLQFLKKVGLDYLTLDRPTDTLSGGELQRVRLATGIGSGLSGILYILDEPSIGLHPRDNQRLIEALRDLQATGSSVVVVEHDEAMMRQADWLIDFGPGAGRHGGQVVAQGTPAEVMASPDSLTGQYLAGQASIAVPNQRRQPVPKKALILEGATLNNLKNITAAFPLGLFIGVSGVSGSGKSSLINETLAPALVRHLGGIAAKPGPHTALRGVEHIDKVIGIDQSPIGRTPRSNAATYTGAFDEIRKVFAATKEAKQLGFKASRFSFNVPGGRCDECEGQGTKRIEMRFLPDLFVACPVCEGRRFNRQTLSVRYKGLSIADVLGLPIADALEFFENFPAIHRVLTSLSDVGLGYLSLGQSSTTLSGGESQRIKLATELARTDTGKTVYLLDEPTTGLHFDDIRRLLGVLKRLVDRGNTVIVIEHNLDVLKSCDWLLDLGPEGGAAGGHLLAAGAPESLTALENNATGRFLRATLPPD